MNNDILERFTQSIGYYEERLRIVKKIERKIEQLKYEIDKLNILADPDLILNDLIITAKVSHKVTSINYPESHKIPDSYKSNLLEILKNISIKKQGELNDLSNLLINFENMSIKELEEISNQL